MIAYNMEKRVRTLKPILVILSIYALLLLTANLLHAIEGNLLTWRGMRSHYHAASFYMLYGTAIMISLFCWLKEDGEVMWRYFLMGIFFLLLTFFINDLYLYIFARTPYESRWIWNKHFPIVIYLCITLVTKFKRIEFSGKPLTAPVFFVIALVSGGLVKWWALRSIIDNGEDVLSWDLVAFNSVSLLICCLIMYTVYKIALTASETKMNQQMKLPGVLKTWFILCILMHLLFAYNSWIAIYSPEKNGLIFHLGIVVGLCAMLFNKRIGWWLFCLPLTILLFAQSHFWLNWIIVQIHPEYSMELLFIDYFGLPETFLLALELIIAWYFVKRKHITQNVDSI